MLGEYLLSHAIAIAVAFASLVMVVLLLDSKRSAQSTLAWLLGIVFVPFVAIPLFLLLGRRKFPRRAKTASAAPVTPAPPQLGEEPAVAAMLRRSLAAPARSGNAFELITTGERAYERLLGLIRGAERCIDLTLFILGEDEVGRSVIEALAESAARGVTVRVILDAVGSSRALRRARTRLQASGGELRVFMPLRHSPIRGRTNLRSHRKLAVFDGNVVFGGGMNVALEYMGPEPLAAGARWRDVAAVLRGPVAVDATALFESDWRYCGGLSARPPVEVRPCGDETVQIVASGPDMRADTVYDALLTAIYSAREELALVTPYYVPDEALQHALVLAARRGVRADVVVPAHSNHHVADIARGALLRELTEAGVSVHYYEAGMVHAKAFYADETCAYVGSPNFDMRSLFLNYENAFFLYSPAAVGSVREYVHALRQASTTRAPDAPSNWVIERVARLLAPEL